MIGKIESDLKAEGVPARFTLSQAAKIAEVAYLTLWRAVRCGRLRAIRRGGPKGRWFVRRPDLAAYMAAGGDSFTSSKGARMAGRVGQ